jgi:hypothetical protein
MPFQLTITPEAKAQIQSIMDDAAKSGLQKQLKKAFGYLSANPKHPGLNSHPLSGAEKALGVKVWTSYVQNRTPQAHRILWTYGKKKDEIVILAVIPHY